MIRHNSLGQLIHPTEAGIVAFWKWFGKSKLVDCHGRPIVWYHQTNNVFKQFDPTRGGGVAGAGIYLSNLPIDDDRYGEINMPLYARARQVADFSVGDKAINNAAISMGLDGLFSHMTISQLREWSRKFRVRMVKRGWDAASIHPDNPRPGEVHLVVYKAANVKSAIGNRGTFDPEDPVISNPLGRLTSLTLEAPNGLATYRYGSIAKGKVMLTIHESDGFRWGLRKRQKLKSERANSQIRRLKAIGWKVVQRHRLGTGL